MNIAWYSDTVVKSNKKSVNEIAKEVIAGKWNKEDSSYYGRCVGRIRSVFKGT